MKIARRIAIEVIGEKKYVPESISLLGEREFFNSLKSCCCDVTSSWSSSIG